MKILLSKGLALFTFLGILSFSYAQNADTRWGKIEEDEWKMTRCPFDTAASAVILLDIGRIYFLGGEAIIERHRRIKILDEKGLEYANVEVPFVRYDNRESIKEVKAQVFNLDAAGKAQKTEVHNNQEFIEAVSDYSGAMKIAFPAVKKGAILEYRYKFYTQNFYFLKPWFFQNELPTLHSQVSIEVPSYLNYNVIRFGERLKKVESKKGEANWTLRQLAGYNSEKFVFQPLDYVDQIQFQLLSYDRTNTQSLSNRIETVEVLKSWDALGDDILESCNSFLNREKSARETVAMLLNPADTPKEKLQTLFSYTQNHYTWNKFWSITPSRSFSDFESNKTGNTAEINLALTTLLREAGWEADPVLISTRQHGKIIQSFPLLSQFNHLICRAISGKDTVFLDAAVRQYPHPAFLLPKEDLNFYGFVIKKDHFQWVDISPWKESRFTTSVKLDFTKATGELKCRYEGYSAMDARYDWYQQKEKYTPFEKASEVGEQQVTLGAPMIEGLEELEKPFELKYTFALDTTASDLLYLNLSNWSHFAEMPFKAPTRTFPVELDYPVLENFLLTITLPAGYTVESLPKEVAVQLNTGKEVGKFTFNAKVYQNQLVITSRISLKEVIFPADFYPSLRSFYEQIHNKFNEIIVLKKG